MAVRRRSFSTNKPQGTDDVVVLDVNEGAQNASSFPCVNRIPGIVLVEFIANLDEDNPSAAGGAVMSFLRASIRPDHFERFLDYCRKPENGVDLPDLVEMCGWLAEQYTGENPTHSSPAFLTGLATNGPGQWEQPFGQGSTSADSPLTNSSFLG